MATDSGDCASKDELSSKKENMPDVPVTVDPSNAVTHPALREDLVATAVHFLQNPRVQKSPLSQKRAFLLKKGLTEKEVDLALDRSAMSGVIPKDGVVPTPQTLQGLQYPGMQAMVPWQPGLYSSPTVWQRWREFCSSAVVIGATCYGIYYLYKQYLEPALIGKKRIEEERLDRVERHLLELNKSLSQLRNTLVAVETSLAKQPSTSGNRHKGDLETASEVQDIISLAEIKAEMSSIKALLLSRKQFPSAPLTSTNIPAWQLEQQKQQEDNKEQRDETVPKQIAEETGDAVHSITNGMKVNGDVTEDN